MTVVSLGIALVILPLCGGSGLVMLPPASGLRVISAGDGGPARARWVDASLRAHFLGGLLGHHHTLSERLCPAGPPPSRSLAQCHRERNARVSQPINRCGFRRLLESCRPDRGSNPRHGSRATGHSRHQAAPGTTSGIRSGSHHLVDDGSGRFGRGVALRVRSRRGARESLCHACRSSFERPLLHLAALRSGMAAAGTPYLSSPGRMPGRAIFGPWSHAERQTPSSVLQAGGTGPEGRYFAL